MDDKEPILNLASNEYFKAIDTKVIKSEAYSANFKQLKTENLRLLSFPKKEEDDQIYYDNDITDIADIKSFDYDGYIFHEELSTEKELIFKVDN